MRLSLSLAARCCSFTLSRHATVAFHVTLARGRPSVRQEESDRRRREQLKSAFFPSMALRDELLKAIWHAFTSLDVDQSGKVSKSQLKVNTVSGLSECVCEAENFTSRFMVTLAVCLN